MYYIAILQGHLAFDYNCYWKLRDSCLTYFLLFVKMVENIDQIHDSSFFS